MWWCGDRQEGIGAQYGAMHACLRWTERDSEVAEWKEAPMLIGTQSGNTRLEMQREPP